MHLFPHSLTFFAVLALILIVAAIPLILRKVPRNPWYGLRIPHTLNGSEEDWYSLNRKAGLVLLAIGTLLLPGAMLLGDRSAVNKQSPVPAHQLTPFFLGLAVVFILFAIPLVLGRVPRNRWYGIRTPDAMQGTEDDWYAINRRGGRIFLTLGLIVLVASLILQHLQP